MFVLFLILTIFTAERNESLTAHPFHVSVAEIEYNSVSKKLECALRIWPEDLEKALNKSSTEKIDLDATKDIDKRIFKYMQSKIKIADDGKVAKLIWVGKEMDIKQGWLYFEVETGVPPVGFSFSNQMFFELQDDQVNMFNFRFEDRRASISFTNVKSRHQLSEEDFVPIRNPFAKRAKEVKK
jgi:hypothetical protein